ncbi:hypothetical protein COEREDRAFT_6279 [Coemansia reversa NRRL 1564]|uniref:SGNH hydrolase n=1 Tax=Coemansia reversa (strain ATCC 12441 / NRRL 1564) TaxID=763665 RepID=A0A2G5BHS9_COERN|nr:hypothetical protein COEREDRAFT_6279 [Coemansia reversa NRRL 1564]|eukprot:PIA18563.1 hypothetical protein COEREDRAFT_6279 [Coemansia reversa NRRL 1564]
MQLTFQALVTVAVLAESAICSSNIPTLYVFGDSLSDIGVLKNLTNGLVPPSPYWEGRFSSGPVWNEYTARLIGYNLYNTAAAGSTMDNDFSNILKVLSTKSMPLTPTGVTEEDTTTDLVSSTPADKPFKIPKLDLSVILDIIPGLSKFIGGLLSIVPGLLDVLSELINALTSILPLNIPDVDLSGLLNDILSILPIKIPGLGEEESSTLWKRISEPSQITVPSVQTQLGNFKAVVDANPTMNISQKDIAVLEVGSTDLIVGILGIASNTITPDEFVERLLDSVIAQVKQLHEIGFKNIIVVDMLALQHTPFADTLNVKELFSNTVELYNKKLAEGVDSWASSVDGLGFASVAELGKFVEVTIGSSKILNALGIINTENSCLGADILGIIAKGEELGPTRFASEVKQSLVCSDPSVNYFFDIVHPAERIQRLFGYYFSERLTYLSNGKSLEIDEASILDTIQKHDLGTPAPKPAQI